jgi:hypothetical protein
LVLGLRKLPLREHTGRSRAGVALVFGLLKMVLREHTGRSRAGVALVFGLLKMLLREHTGRSRAGVALVFGLLKMLLREHTGRRRAGVAVGASVRRHMGFLTAKYAAAGEFVRHLDPWTVLRLAPCTLNAVVRAETRASDC